MRSLKNARDCYGAAFQNERTTRAGKELQENYGIRGLERVKGIEPSYSAWKAAALPLSYTRAGVDLSRCAGGLNPARTAQFSLRTAPFPPAPHPVQPVPFNHSGTHPNQGNLREFSGAMQLKKRRQTTTRQPGYGVRPLESQWETGEMGAAQIAKPGRA